MILYEATAQLVNDLHQSGPLTNSAGGAVLFARERQMCPCGLSLAAARSYPLLIDLLDGENNIADLSHVRAYLSSVEGGRSDSIASIRRFASASSG